MEFGSRLTVGLIAIATICAATAATETEGLDIPDELMDDLLGTTLSVGLRGSAGFKDNVLLTETGKIESAFLRAELDAFLWRPPETLTDVYWTISGGETYYIGAPKDARSERVWITQAEIRYAIGTYFKAGLAVQGYYQDQVLDLSAGEIGTFRARLKVAGVTGGPNLRWEIWNPWWFEVSAGWKLEIYEGAPEDFDEPGYTVRIGRKLGKRHDLSAAWTWRGRDYHDRNAYTVGGRPLPGTTLSTRWEQWELRLVSKWTDSGSWTSTLKFAGDRLRDSAFGFFDYDHWRADADVKWKRGPWEVRARFSRGAHDYLVQLAGTGFDPASREIVQTGLTLSAERRISDRLTGFAEIEAERNRTNDPDGSFRVNTAFAGIAFEF